MKPSRPSNPSAHDVARLARVSQSAVSRAFTPGASVAPRTREKIMRAANSVGYRPNRIARSLITGQSGIIGTVIGNAKNPCFVAALDALSAQISQADRHLLIHTTEGGALADPHIERLLSFQVDAILLMATTISPELAEVCRDAGIPVIFYYRQLLKSEPFSSVSCNNEDGARKIAEHLLAQGYRQLAFMAGYDASESSQERESAFSNYLKSVGMPAPIRECGLFQRAAAMDAARRLLNRKTRPDAIFCANDYMAIATMEVARQEFGLQVGRDLGVAGFDNIDQASWPSFDLTTYVQPIDAMVRHVADILLTEDLAEQPMRNIVVDGEFKPRGSTQRARS